jgi:hypothetical protein
MQTVIELMSCLLLYYYYFDETVGRAYLYIYIRGYYMYRRDDTKATSQKKKLYKNYGLTSHILILSFNAGLTRRVSSFMPFKKRDFQEAKDKKPPSKMMLFVSPNGPTSNDNNVEKKNFPNNSVALSTISPKAIMLVTSSMLAIILSPSRNRKRYQMQKPLLRSLQKAS